MSEPFAEVLAELWRQCRDEIGALKAEGETWPVLFLLLDGADPRVGRLTRRLADEAPADPIPDDCRMCVRNHATARKAIEGDLGLGWTIDDPRGADPKNGFWLVLAFGRYVVVALNTVRLGEPFTVRQWETTLASEKEEDAS